MRRNRPTDHALRVVSLGGISMPTFWIALVALYVGFYRSVVPGRGRLDPASTRRPSPASTRSTRCSTATGRSSASRSTTSPARRSCSPPSTSAC
jgi:peptide/nickel transport system permease protein